MSNSVIGGDYKNGVLEFGFGGKVSITYWKGFLKTGTVIINRETVANYQIIDKNSTKSFSSGLARGAVGGALFGPVGAIAGANSAKSKDTYLVEVQFKDGCRSLLELDKNGFYLLTNAL